MTNKQKEFNYLTDLAEQYNRHAPENGKMRVLQNLSVKDRIYTIQVGWELIACNVTFTCAYSKINLYIKHIEKMQNHVAKSH